MTDDELKSLFESLRQENVAAHIETRNVLRTENAAAHTETRNVLRAENAAAHTETRDVLRAENAAAHTETRDLLRAENAATHTETRRHFDIALEAARHEIRLVAEAVAHTREEFLVWLRTSKKRLSLRPPKPRQ